MSHENKKFFLKVESPWGKILIVLTIIEYIILFTHLLPENLVSKIRENGLAAIILVWILAISLVYVLFRCIRFFENEIQNRTASFQTNELALKGDLNKNNIEIEQLKEKMCVLEKEAKYAEVFPHLNVAFIELHNAVRADFQHESQYKGALQTFCDALAIVFTNLKGQTCHVCMKITQKINTEAPSDSKNVKTKTLFRDKFEANRISADKAEIIHICDHNTDHEYIFKYVKSEKGKYYFCNDLVTLHDYKNTSFIASTDTESFTFTTNTAEEREEKWPLAYKSCIVVPINDGIQNAKDDKFIGFLSIDAANKNVFNEKIDTHIMTGCSDALYNTLSDFLALLTKNATAHAN